MILISFSVKIPIYIFHFLIKNIIEVPYYTVLIIILPSVMPKLGRYGTLRLYIYIYIYDK